MVFSPAYSSPASATANVIFTKEDDRRLGKNQEFLVVLDSHHHRNAVDLWDNTGEQSLAPGHIQVPLIMHREGGSIGGDRSL